MNKILKCLKCSLYTLKKICPKCHSKTESTRSAKYSPKNKTYAKYRLKIKKEAGLI